MEVSMQPFGETAEGLPVALYTLVNGQGMEVTITNYGGIIVSLLAPDRDGLAEDVVLGFNSLDEYLERNPFFGCVVGRYANRIGEARFALNGVEYSLAQNSGPNHIHGGAKGFDKVLWKADRIVGRDEVGVRLAYKSRDGEEGYPGNLDVTLTYSLTRDNELRIDYRAETDRDTIVNLTNHSYFNLSGDLSGNVLDHEMMIHATTYTPVNSSLIPTGELKDVSGTPMDFTLPAAIGARIGDDYEQLRIGGGYDHNFVLKKEEGDRLSLAARTRHPGSGRVMETYTTKPGMQFFTGNFLNGSIHGKQGIPYEKHAGFCLETQHFPDSPNKPEFPSPVLRAGDTYEETTIYKFLVEE